VARFSATTRCNHLEHSHSNTLTIQRTKKWLRRRFDGTLSTTSMGRAAIHWTHWPCQF